MSQFQDQCSKNRTTWTEACSFRILRSLQLDPNVVVTQCIAAAGGIVPYPPPGPRPSPIPRNTLIDREMADLVAWGIFYTPTIFVRDFCRVSSVLTLAVAAGQQCAVPRRGQLSRSEQRAALRSARDDLHGALSSSNASS